MTPVNDVTTFDDHDCVRILSVIRSGTDICERRSNHNFTLYPSSFFSRLLVVSSASIPFGANHNFRSASFMPVCIKLHPNRYKCHIFFLSSLFPTPMITWTLHYFSCLLSRPYYRRKRLQISLDNPSCR